MLPIKEIQTQMVALLRDLIKTPSFSGQENATADIIKKCLSKLNISNKRIDNNIIARNLHWSDNKPTILLNSHHDTVQVVNGWTRDPHGAELDGDKLFGLGSNDAGGCLVSLIGSFIHFYNHEYLPFNLMLACSAEEENFGPYGMRSLIGTEIQDISLGIIGEPTGMNLAVAEKGLLVIDGESRGVAGHAARKEGDNAIYKAIKDIETIEHFKYEKVSQVLGSNVITVTQVNAGYQHNVVPDSCKFVIDLRVNELYTLQEAFDLINKATVSRLTARSFRNNPSGIPMSHPVVKRGIELGMKTYGSPTLSDQVHMPFYTIKVGPGESERSHTPDEFIYLDEISIGIEKYIGLLQDLELRE